MNKIPYSKDELFEKKGQRSFPGNAREAAFLLGGIGTGNVSVGARGELKDWELFNQPGKGNYFPYSFFAIRAKKDGDEPVSKVLESRLVPPFSKSHGFGAHEAAGLPRLDSSVMKGEYPFVEVVFSDEALPVEVSLEAFTPFIPLNSRDSGIPGAVLRYKVKNKGHLPVDVTLAGSLANLTGLDRYETTGWENVEMVDKGSNAYREGNGLRGLWYTWEKPDEGHLRFGNMALVTSDTQVTYKVKWLDGGHWDGLADFWEDFSRDGLLEPQSVYTAKDAKDTTEGGWVKIGSLGICHRLAPLEEKTFQFILTWYFPNRMAAWYPEHGQKEGGGIKTVRNYYATLFSDAWHAGWYLNDNLTRLESLSRDFHRALFGSTLPDYVLDALAANITVLRSPTCFRLEDGTFASWEGCFDIGGCCEGSCTHVWNYAQTAAFLFPDLEHSLRKVEFNLETNPEGRMKFRTNKIFGIDPWEYHPAADGQMGTLIRLYRDWKLSGDDELLRSVWDNAAKALDFAFTYWDRDGDFMMDTSQHNTYDIEFQGPNSLTNTMWYTALKAGGEMAEYLGDREHAQKYRTAFEQGAQRMDNLLWGGEYYIQKLDDVNEYRYQYGRGCLSDQLFGQLLAHVNGLGYILPRDHVKTAILSVYRNNFLEGFSQHENLQRTYALNDEKGLVLCTWPEGGKPRLPFIYSDEVWTGVEYQVAAHLIYEGYIEEGLSIVKALRERHDGFRRNPWSEAECGHHYVRSMASWTLLLALSGFRCDLTKGELDFSPAVHEDDFSVFFSTGKAWGIYSQKRDGETQELYKHIELLYDISDCWGGKRNESGTRNKGG